MVILTVVLLATSAWAEVDRISPSDARFMVKTGQALLVCAYDDVGKCAEIRLEGSIDLATLQKVGNALRRDSTVIFFCT
jgi:hypothetical protein